MSKSAFLNKCITILNALFIYRHSSCMCVFLVVYVNFYGDEDEDEDDDDGSRLGGRDVLYTSVVVVTRLEGLSLYAV